MNLVSTILYNDCFSEKWIRFLSPAEWKENVSISYDSVAVDLVEPAGCHTDPDVVQGWMDTIAECRPVPPPVASLTERGTYYLHDGNHRFEALRNIGAPTVRLAIVMPLPGFGFVRCRYESFETYELQARPSIPKVIRALIGVVTACALALLLTRLNPGTDKAPFFALLMASVVICVRWCGFIAGMLAAAVNVLCAAYLLLPPINSIRIEDEAHLVQLSITGFAMLLIPMAMLPKQRVYRFLQRRL
jgi:hypothetical protein